MDFKAVFKLIIKSELNKFIKMERLENEFETISRSHCRVGKITSKINLEDEEKAVLIDFKTEDFKGSIEDFIEKKQQV